MKPIYFNKYMSNMNISQRDSCKNNTDAIDALIEKHKEPIDIVTYNETKNFSLGSDDIKIDNYGNYYYEYTVPRISDVIDNIRVGYPNIKVTYHIGCEGTHEYIYNSDTLKQFILIASPFQRIRIRVTFLERPTIFPLEFSVYWRNYVMGQKYRLTLSQHKVITETLIYAGGLSLPNLHTKL